MDVHKLCIYVESILNAVTSISMMAFILDQIISRHFTLEIFSKEILISIHRVDDKIFINQG